MWGRSKSEKIFLNTKTWIVMHQWKHSHTLFVLYMRCVHGGGCWAKVNVNCNAIFNQNYFAYIVFIVIAIGIRESTISHMFTPKCVRLVVPNWSFLGVPDSLSLSRWRLVALILSEHVECFPLIPLIPKLVACCWYIDELSSWRLSKGKRTEAVLVSWRLR